MSRNPFSEDGKESTGAPYFLFLERCRYTRSKGTELNPLPKGKGFSKTRNRP